MGMSFICIYTVFKAMKRLKTAFFRFSPHLIGHPHLAVPRIDPALPLLMFNWCLPDNAWSTSRPWRSPSAVYVPVCFPVATASSMGPARSATQTQWSSQPGCYGFRQLSHTLEAARPAFTTTTTTPVRSTYRHLKCKITWLAFVMINSCYTLGVHHYTPINSVYCGCTLLSSKYLPQLWLMYLLRLFCKINQTLPGPTDPLPAASFFSPSLSLDCLSLG